MSEKMTQLQAEQAARKFDLTLAVAEGFEVGAVGKQNYHSDWDSETKKSFYKLVDTYDLALDLSGNDGERIGKVKVKLPGLEIELGIGWFALKTDYGWKNYIEYDAPKAWKRDVLEEES